MMASAALGLGLVLLLIFIFQTQILIGNSQGSDCVCNSTNSRCDNSGLCRCDPGWEGPGCTRCALMPGCVHGSCELPWQCVCDPGWGGRFCSKDLGACQTRPCLHGGSCRLDDGGDVICLCPEGFHGDRCQLRAGPCHQHRSPCLNGGQCEDDSGFSASFSCRCRSGFAGSRCELNVDDCALSPCANGATCTDGVNRFTCRCAAGFSGRFCSVNVDECASRPCANGGRCVDLANGYRCLCRHGYSGPACLSPAPANHSQRTLRVTLSERSSAPSLSRAQVIAVVTLAAATVALVTLTAALVLRARCHALCHAPWRRWGRGSRTEKV